jgi:hypothetical protein
MQVEGTGKCIGLGFRFSYLGGVLKTMNLLGLDSHPANLEIALRYLPPIVFVVVLVLLLLLLRRSVFGLLLPSKIQIQLFNTTRTPSVCATYPCDFVEFPINFRCLWGPTCRLN